MVKHVESGDAKQLIVQLKDGSTWTAEIDLDGRVNLLKQLVDPENPDAKNQADKEQKALQPAQKQPKQRQPSQQEAWGDGTAKQQQGNEATSVKDLLEKLQHREKKLGGTLGDNNRPRGRDIPDKLLTTLNDAAFRSRLSSVMLDNKYDRRVKGRTRGKLDMTKLFKIPTGSRSVFMQKQARKGKKYSVVFLVDQSSSMEGKPIMLAAESILFLARQFSGLGLDIGVIGYNTSVYVHKELHEAVDYDKLYKRVSGAGGGTSSDYDAMRRGYKMLSKAEGEKIMIMLSDGGPGMSSTGRYVGTNDKNEQRLPKLDSNVNWNEQAHLHHLVKSHKDVHSVGIGIQAGGWQIPDHEVIQNVQDLKKTVIKQLRRHIARG